jgi:hypothetical protein
MLDEAKHTAAFGVSFAKPYAAFWKSSICRIQLVSGFLVRKTEILSLRLGLAIFGTVGHSLRSWRRRRPVARH